MSALSSDQIDNKNDVQFGAVRIRKNVNNDLQDGGK